MGSTRPSHRVEVTTLREGSVRLRNLIKRRPRSDRAAAPLKKKKKKKKKKKSVKTQMNLRVLQSPQIS
jgi:hypothetical protein